MTCDPKQLAFHKEIMDGAVDRIVNNPKAKALNMTDNATFEWLWHKATKKPWGLDITKSDVKRFNRLSKEWLNGLGRRKTWFERMMFLPQRLVDNTVGGDRFVKTISEASSYHQRQMKESSKNIEKMITGLYEMFNDKSSPIIAEFGRGLTKAEYKKFQELERKLLSTKRGTPEFEVVYRELVEATDFNMPDGTSLLGRITQRYQKLLDFTELPVTQNEKNIVQEWNSLRAESMKNLLNGAISARRAVEALNNPLERDYLVRAISKIQEKIDALLIQSSVDMKTVKSQPGAEGWEKIWTNGLEVYDPATGKVEKYKTFDANKGEFVVGIKKYFPKYVIELSDIIKNVTDFALNKDRTEWKNMGPEALEQAVIEGISPEKITNRLKQAADESKYFSLDPVYYLNKYVHDVANFNFRSRINHGYVLTMKDLIKTVRKQNLSDKDATTDVGDFAHEMIDIINEIRNSALNNNSGTMSEMDNIVRIINGFEYVSKLGFSLKSGVKNRGQALFNWTEYGWKGRRLSKQFYNETSRESTTNTAAPTNEAMLQNQLKRFGMLMGERAEAALSAATAGSIDAVVVPQGFSVDKTGSLIIAKQSKLQKASDNMARLAEISSKYSIIGSRGSQQWAENKNRLSTFRMAFAHAFKAEKRRFDYWKDKLSTKNKEATTEQIYDAIENAAGNHAQEMVKTLHFDYDNWAKARILRSKTGKTLGQFQHFKFAFFDLQYKILKDAYRDAKDLNIVDINPATGKKEINPNFSRAFRMGSLYSLIPGLFALVTDTDIGGLFSTVGHTFGLSGDKEEYEGRDMSSRGGIIDNPIIEEAFKIINYMGADPEGDSDVYGNKKYGTYFGKNPIAGTFLGPFVSDILTVAELTDFWNQTDEDYEYRKGLYMDTNDPNWWYQMARIINIQGARTAWHTLPALLKGQWEKALRIETGAFKPKWLIGGEPATKFRKRTIIDPTVRAFNLSPILPDIKTKKKKKKALSNEDILRSLGNF